MPVSEYGARPEPFPEDRCPTPQFHLPDRVACGNCTWSPARGGKFYEPPKDEK